MKTLTESEAETISLAAKTAQKIRPGDIIFLQGGLGAGKSVFARALIRNLMNEPGLEVPSPTFTLLQTYEAPLGPLWHFDLYRVKDENEIYELGWEEALGGGIVIVEWPERLKDLRPVPHLDIGFSTLENKPNSRMIQIIEKR